MKLIRRPRYGCRACEGAIVQAAAPERPIDGGMATEALIAQVLVGKYSEHLPLYRQAQVFARHGIEFGRSTLSLWVGRACWWLEPLYERWPCFCSNRAALSSRLRSPSETPSSFRSAIAHARALDHPHSLAFALNVATELLLRLRSGSGLRVLGGELAHLGKARGFGFHTSGGIVALGCADALEGRHADAIARLQQGLEGYMAANAGYQVPIVLGELARACAGSGRLAEAAVHVREALAAGERTGERSAEPELQRIEGDILLASGQGTAPGERCFLEALATAKRHGAVWWQLRAAVSLARLWASGGDRQRAVDLLSPVYASFTEGFDTPDLRDARALIDALQ